jgi:hypothetical protein
MKLTRRDVVKEPEAGLKCDNAQTPPAAFAVFAWLPALLV